MLTVEERAAVAEDVGDRDEGDREHEQRHREDRERYVDDPLQSAVAVAMHLADVEHERDSFELTEWQLAEPLLVEQ